MKGYCCKCRTKREMIDVNEVFNKKGIKMAKGTCKTCGTKMCKMIGNK